MNSESYNWTSKFWRHCLINHYNHMANVSKTEDPLDAILRSDYSGFSFLDEYSISKSLDKDYGKLSLEVDLLKKHKDLSRSQSLQYNMVLLVLYEHIKNQEIFKSYDKIRTDIYKKYNPFLSIDNKIVTQQ